MWNRPGKPTDAPWIIPYLTFADPGEALRFYAEAFGFVERFAQRGQDGLVEHAEMNWAEDGKIKEGRIMLGPESDLHTAKAPMTSGVPAPVALYVYTDDVAALHTRAIAAGAEEIEEPAVTFWGDRVAILADPFGYKWTFAQNLADYDPTIATR
ncbi:MAG: putative glyoxalase superfamily protein PhnB [Myxococcota bacterium]|jgi:uncharacterized glyoxalase superfamily protein PhnB